MGRISISVFVYVILFSADALFAQKADSVPAWGQAWTMQQCITYAWNNNLQVKQAELTREISKNNLLQSKAALLPSVNGYASRSYDYGLTINPFTNTFADKEVTADEYALSGSFTIFGGFQNMNTVKEDKLNYQASSLDMQYSMNNIAISVAQDYLQILLDKELLTEAQSQKNISTQQVTNTKKLVDAGSLAKSNLLDVQAQEANDEVNLIEAQNQLNIGMLALAQLMNLDSVQMLTIVAPEITIPENNTLDVPDAIYTKALTSQPDVQSAELKWESSVRSEAAAKGALYPKLSLNASIGTGYSTANTEVIGQNVTMDTIATTIPSVSILFPNTSYVTQEVPYGKQLKNNRNESFGFRLSIPIFNGLQSTIAAQNAKLNAQNAYYSYQLSQQNLRKTIEQAYTDALGALKKYHAEEKSVASLREAFSYAQSKFDVGMTTSLDYNTAKTNLIKAESDLLQAKYSYVFKVKVLDFYEGKPLKL